MYNKESHDTIDERTFVFQDKDYTILHWFSRTAVTGRAGNFCFQNKKPARQQDGVDEAKQKAEKAGAENKKQSGKTAQTEAKSRCSKRKKNGDGNKKRSGKTAQTKARNRRSKRKTTGDGNKTAEWKTGTDRSTKPVLEAEKAGAETRSGAESRRVGVTKPERRNPQGDAQNRRIELSKTTRNNAIRQSQAEDGKKAAAEAERDRPKRTKNSQGPKNKATVSPVSIRQMASGITVRNALIPASNKMRIYATDSFRTCKPAEFARTPFLFYKISLKKR